MDDIDYARFESLAHSVLGRALRAHPVPADGHCQFHALLAALRAAARRGGTELDVDALDALDAYALRARLVDWLRDNSDMEIHDDGSTLRGLHNARAGCEPFLDGSDAWDAYLACMRRREADAFGLVEWGDGLTVMAAACSFNVTIKVIMLESAVSLNTIHRPLPWANDAAPIVFLGIKEDVHYIAMLEDEDEDPPAPPQLVLESGAKAAAGDLRLTCSVNVGAGQRAAAARTPPRESSVPPGRLRLTPTSRVVAPLSGAGSSRAPTAALGTQVSLAPTALQLADAPHTPRRSGSEFASGFLLGGTPARLDPARTPARFDAQRPSELASPPSIGKAAKRARKEAAGAAIEDDLRARCVRCGVGYTSPRT